jgi:hypothetical protein
MSDYNFQTFTPDGRNAISSLYSSYYIYSEGTAALGNPNPYGLGTATIVMPTQVMPYQMPLLLLKNTNKAEVGCYRANLSGSTLVSWQVFGGGNNCTTFDYAIAVSENGVTTSDKYGMQILGPDGANVLFDSRRTNNLIFKGIGGIGAGYFTEGAFNTGTTSYDYFTAPMFSKNVWVWTGSQSYVGVVCCRGTSPTTGYATAYVLVSSPANLGTGGSPAASMLFFSKAT